MLAVKDFLNEMPKSQLKELHAKAFCSKGLLNNAKILSETNTFFTDTARFETFYTSLEPWKKLCLFLIYHSENRGLEMNELRLVAPANKREELETFLLDCAKNLYIWRSRTEKNTYVYFGFDDFLKGILLSPENPVDEKARFFSYEDMLVWHLCQMLSFARLGKMKMNGTGNLHRRSMQICEESFKYSRQLSPDAVREECTLLLEFLSSHNWIEQRGMDLLVTDEAFEFLKHNGFRLKNEILEWWIKRRFHGEDEFFKHVLFSIKRNASAVNAQRILWTLDPTFRLTLTTNEIYWSSMPKPLAELWLMGMVEFSANAGAITAIRLSDWAKDWLSATAAPMLGAQISTLPNFEMIISVKSAPRVLFMSACLANVQNDEPYLRFSISRDTFLNGLKTGFSRETTESFEGWISAPPNVQEAMREWSSCYYDSSFSSVRLLKIDNGEVREALTVFPQFMEMVNEAIPGYGFLIKQECEPKIRELLKHYGLEPANPVNEAPVEQFHNTDWNKAFWLRWTPEGTPDSAFKPETDGSTVSAALGTTKYGGDFQKFAMVDLFKVLRYARSTNGSIEARLSQKPLDKNMKLPKLPPEIRFKVEALHFSKVPFVAKITLEPSGKSLELPLESITELRMAKD